MVWNGTNKNVIIYMSNSFTIEKKHSIKKKQNFIFLSLFFEGDKKENGQKHCRSKGGRCQFIKFTCFQK